MSRKVNIQPRSITQCWLFNFHDPKGIRQLHADRQVYTRAVQGR